MTTNSIASSQALADRLRKTLEVARISPRHLGGATRIHFTTLYRLLRAGDTGMFPIHAETLTQALDKIDVLVAAGKLPIEGKLVRVDKTRRLAELLTEHN